MIENINNQNWLNHQTHGGKITPQMDIPFSSFFHLHLLHHARPQAVKSHGTGLHPHSHGFFCQRIFLLGRQQFQPVVPPGIYESMDWWGKSSPDTRVRPYRGPMTNSFSHHLILGMEEQSWKRNEKNMDTRQTCFCQRGENRASVLHVFVNTHFRQVK